MGMTGTDAGGGELYTASVGHLRDNSENAGQFKAVEVVHAVGKAGYVSGKPGTPTSTGPLKTPTIFFFFFHV
jgi:hypothetical protein